MRVDKVEISNLLFFHLHFYKPIYIHAINISRAAVLVYHSQCFVVQNAVYRIKFRSEIVEIRQ